MKTSKVTKSIHSFRNTKARYLDMINNQLVSTVPMVIDSLVPVPTHKVPGQIPSKLKVLVPPILAEGAIIEYDEFWRRSTSVPRETNGQDQTTPEHVSVASVSLSAL